MKNEILEKQYLSAKDIKQLIPTWGINSIQKFMDEIINEMVEKGYYIIPTNKKLVLTKLVRKRLGI